MKIELETLKVWAGMAMAYKEHFRKDLGLDLAIDIPLNIESILPKFYRAFSRFGLDLTAYSLDEIRTNRRSDGARLGKILAKSVPEHLRPSFVEAWDAWQFLLRPRFIRISAHPLDLFLISENTTGWRTCQSLDGAYFWGPIVYAFDSITLVAYAHDNQDKDVFFDFAPRKFWRVLVYRPNGLDGFLIAKEYPKSEPFFFNAVLENAARILLGCSTNDLLEVYHTDIAFETFEHGPYVDPVRIFVRRGYQIPKEIRIAWSLPSTVLRTLEDCVGVPCSICNTRVDPDWAFIFNDYVLCEDCYRENVGHCEKCFCEVWKSDLRDADGMLVCPDCAQRLPKCDACGFPTYSPHVFMGKAYCSVCAQDIKITCHMCGQDVPVAESLTFDGHPYCRRCLEKMGRMMIPLPF